MTKPRVYGMNLFKTKWACQYYRIDVPLSCFEQFEYADTWNDVGDEGYENSALGLAGADFSLLWGSYGPTILEQVKDVKRIRPQVGPSGEVLLPPILIYDTDDNRDYLHPHNTAFCKQGVRGYPDTSLLRPGDTLWSIDEKTSKRVEKWVDKETSYGGTVFDIARNLQDMRATHEIFRTVDGVTVASPHLARYMRDVIGVKHVHFFPNTIIPTHYQSFPLIPHTGVRILWQGSSSHIIDWSPLRTAVKEVAAKYPDVMWVVFGQQDDWVDDNLPPNRVERHPWVDYAAYKLKRGLLQVDINLCPLVDNYFNRCKSAIKWYEGSVWDVPEATLAARVSPFSDEMTDGENGLLYDTPKDFAHKLGILIEQADLRKRLAQSAKQWVMQNRTPKQTIPPLWEFYQELQQRRIGEVLATR
jgi:glycosyltransferase involved in cell wall biosynthesis